MIETVDFQPTETNTNVTFNDASVLGKSKLHLIRMFCSEHKDKDDENQIVTFPGIQQRHAMQDHVSNATDSITWDTVAYTGLKKEP